MTDGRTGEAQEAIEAMEARGLDDAERLLAAHLAVGGSPQAALAWCLWWDAQPGVTKRLLAAKIRSGEAPPHSSRELLNDERAYGEQIVAWLRENFPEWNREEGNRTHTAAIAAVIRLHAQVGKGRVTKREHGPEIREAVASFEAEYGSPGEGSWS